MARREVDMSKAVCDKCGELYKDGDGMYSLATKWDEDIEDRDVAISFRHSRCHIPLDKALASLREKAAELDKTFGQVSRDLSSLRNKRR